MSEFHTVETQRLYEGRVVNLRVDSIEVDGHLIQREVIETPQAVVIAPLDALGQILLVRQYRHPPGQRLLELPAGMVERGEELLATAQRELQEETGFAAGLLERIGGFYSAPGFCTEFLHLFIARELRSEPLDGDEDEDIEVVPTPLDRVRDLILSGEIQDAKSIAGLLILFLIQQES